MKVEAFHVDELLKEVLAQLELVPAPVEFGLAHWRVSKMREILEVRMPDRLMH